MRKKLKILFGLILLLVLVAGGFALGVYLRLFDTQALNEEYGLHKLPIIGEYFVPPAGSIRRSPQTVRCIRPGTVCLLLRSRRRHLRA